MLPLERRLSDVLEDDILSIDFFTKGQVGDIYKVNTSQSSYILKTSQPSDILKIESRMLSDIHKYDISVPKVYDVSEEYLLMEYIKESSQPDHLKETQAASLLNRLHSITNESRMYGYYYDTTIGPFNQKNEQTQYNWGLFLGQMRIMPMAKICYEQNKIDKQFMNRLDKLCRELYKRIDMSMITPSLLHGDLWSGNILFSEKRAVLIDPAIYYGDKEMELAFIMMFSTFGDTFFEAYKNIHPLSDDFYDVKVPLYQIYPTLVHVALYGSSYVGSLDNLLKRLDL